MKITMYVTGTQFDLEAPDPAAIHIEDIAFGLARLPRYLGQTRLPITVAEHSVIGSNHIDPRLALEFLLHDAAEAYMGDCIAPLKNRVAELQQVEREIMTAVVKRFDLRASGEVVSAVEKIDLRLRATEMNQATKGGAVEGHTPLEGVSIEHWPEVDARIKFMARFNALMRQREGAGICGQHCPAHSNKHQCAFRSLRPRGDGSDMVDAECSLIRTMEVMGQR